MARLGRYPLCGVPDCPKESKHDRLYLGAQDRYENYYRCDEHEDVPVQDGK